MVYTRPPVSKDKLNINVRMGAISEISWCSSFRILGEISSGPEALFGESPCRSLSTPSIDISIICIFGMGPTCRISFSFLEVERRKRTATQQNRVERFIRYKLLLNIS